jgi:hypothetical protein
VRRAEQRHARSQRRRHPDWVLLDCGLVLPGCVRAYQGWEAPGESPCQHFACGYGGGALGHNSPRWGRHVEPHSWCTGILWVKTLSSSWTDDGGALGVVPSLKASTLETQLGFGNIGLLWSWKTAIGGGGMGASLKGVAELKWRLSSFWWRPGVVTCLLVATCSGPRRLALLGGYQFGAGQSCRMVLVASTTWGD